MLFFADSSLTVSQAVLRGAQTAPRWGGQEGRAGGPGGHEQGGQQAGGAGVRGRREGGGGAPPEPPAPRVGAMRPGHSDAPSQAVVGSPADPVQQRDVGGGGGGPAPGAQTQD